MIEPIIRYFAPQLALKREIARRELGSISRSETYTAADTNRLTGPWNPSNSNSNDIIAASRGTVSSRMRELVRNFPPFIRAVNRSVDFTVGSGIVFQSKAETPKGEIDEKSSKAIEDAYNRWEDEADISGKLHLHEMQRLSKRAEVADGEFLIVKRLLDDPKRFIPLALQIYETDWLSTANDNNENIHQGIEYDPNTYAVRAYHMQNPDSWYSTTVDRIPAEQVVHGFKMDRPGQLRGITPFVGAMTFANDFDDYINAKIDKAKMAAKWLFIVESMTGRKHDYSSENGQKIEEVENCVVENLRAGETITLASDPTNVDIEPMIRLLFQLISIVTDVPFEILTGDYRGMNFTTLKASNNHFEFSLEPVKTRFVWQFCNPIALSFLEIAQYSGALNLPGYWQDPYRFQKMQWQPPRMPETDPLKETKAAADSVTAKLSSPQSHILRRGNDPQGVLKEWKQWNEWLKKYGVTTEEISTALANNPAKIEEQTGDKDNDKKS